MITAAIVVVCFLASVYVIAKVADYWCQHTEGDDTPRRPNPPVERHGVASHTCLSLPRVPGVHRRK